MAAELTSSDVGMVLGVLADLAPVRLPAELRRDALELIDPMVGSQLISWNELVLTDAGAEFAVTMRPDMSRVVPAERMAVLNCAFASHIGEHPVIRHFQRTGDGRPHLISDFLSGEEFHATALYEEFYSQPELSTEDQLSLTLPQPELVIGIALNRPRHDFCERDRLVLNLIRPHLVQAHRNAVAFERTSHIISALEKAVDIQQDGLVLLNRRGVLEYATLRARQLLSEFFPTAGAEALPIELHDWLTGPTNDRVPAWPFVKEQGNRQLLVRRLPMQEGTSLLLSDAPGGVRASDLRRLGLTARQAEVMAHLAQGRATKEVASLLGISPRTVDKHVEQSMRTLGTTNRLAAVSLIRQADWQPPARWQNP